MYCPNCGKENVGNKYCNNCGTLLNNQNYFNQVVQNKSNDNQTISLVLGIVCLIMSFFVNIICLIPGIISIIFAFKYKKESGKLGVGFGLSLGGIIFSVVILLLFCLLFFNLSVIVSENRVDDYLKNQLEYEENDKYNYDDLEFYYIPNMK